MMHSMPVQEQLPYTIAAAETKEGIMKSTKDGIP